MNLPPIDTVLPVAETFTREYLEHYQLLPLTLANGELQVAVGRSANATAIEDLGDFYSARVHTSEVEPEVLLEGIRRAFAKSETVVELVRTLDGSALEGSAVAAPSVDLRDLATQPPVIRYVNLLIREAYEARASDLHLESTDSALAVRFRIDGVLTEAPAPPPNLETAVISRIKLLAELDIAERRAPQDGRIRVRMEMRDLDIRVSTMPTVHGESVVMRLLDRGGRAASLATLGMTDKILSGLERLAAKSHGVLLATGPTGSGKTTTLYALLELRDRIAEKIITVEDPVEYHIAGVTQVPVRAKHGLTFAAALRSLLRQDPDVLLIGEMRDRETAAVAVQAAMTGHLVLSTLHTNDAISAITRLTDLGVEPFLIAATLEGVLAQRLVRCVCSACRVEYRPESSTLASFEDVRSGCSIPTFQRGLGCEVCHQTGFSGRTGLFELVVVDELLRDAVAGNAVGAELRTLAKTAGTRTLLEDGWDRAAAGATTLEEVLRVAN